MNSAVNRSGQACSTSAPSNHHQQLCQRVQQPRSAPRRIASLRQLGTLAPDRSAGHVSSADFELLESFAGRQLPTPGGLAMGAPAESYIDVDEEQDNAWQPRRSKRVQLALLNSMASMDEDEEYSPSMGHRIQPHHLTKEELWVTVREEAWADAAAEPALAPFLYSTILAHPSLEKSLAFLLSNKLSSPSVLGAVQLMGLMQEAFKSDPDIIDAAVADILAVKDRDPACEKYSQAILYFKGYQAIQSHRVSHWLWMQGRQALSLAFQSRASEVFHVDIHPGAHMGRGILLDHATGVVIGETAVVGDNVSMLHHVTLGGSGRGRGEARHPTVGHGVLLGAGVSVLGPIVIGAGSKVGAGSVVVSDLPPHSVAVGVPARIIKLDLKKEPVATMDQCYDFIPDYVI